MSTKDEDFRQLLDQLINDRQAALAVKLQQLTPRIAVDHVQAQAQTVIATWQGTIMLVKLHRSIETLEQAVFYLRQTILEKVGFPNEN